MVQSSEIGVLLLLALILSLVYNIYQAFKRRNQARAVQEKNTLQAQLDQFRHELRSARSDLSNERQRSEVLSKQLSDAGRTRSSFLDHMGYFVRTPLNLIIGYSELLMSGVYGQLTESQMARITVMHRSGNDLLKYFSDMLELHRLETGSVELKIKAVQVAPLVARVIDEQRRSNNKPNVQLEYHIPDSIGQMYADGERVAFVLSHLVSNALRYTEQGLVRVTAQDVSVRDGKTQNLPLPTLGWLRDGDWVVLTVTDTGIGIPAEAQANIFETFYQVNREQSDEQRGIGLGLAIAKRLIELHRGALWVKSAEGEGSTFYVALRAYRDIRATDTQERQLLAKAKSNA